MVCEHVWIGPSLVDSFQTWKGYVQVIEGQCLKCGDIIRSEVEV